MRVAGRFALGLAVTVSIALIVAAVAGQSVSGAAPDGVRGSPAQPSGEREVRLSAPRAGTFISLWPACACGEHTALDQFSLTTGRRLGTIAEVPVGGGEFVSPPAARLGGTVLLTFSRGPRCAGPAGDRLPAPPSHLMRAGRQFVREYGDQPPSTKGNLPLPFYPQATTVAGNPPLSVAVDCRSNLYVLTNANARAVVKYINQDYVPPPACSPLLRRISTRPGISVFPRFAVNGAGKASVLIGCPIKLCIGTVSLGINSSICPHCIISVPLRFRIKPGLEETLSLKLNELGRRLLSEQPGVAIRIIGKLRGGRTTTESERLRAPATLTDVCRFPAQLLDLGQPVLGVHPARRNDHRHDQHGGHLGRGADRVAQRVRGESGCDHDRAPVAHRRRLRHHPRPDHPNDRAGRLREHDHRHGHRGQRTRRPTRSRRRVRRLVPSPHRRRRQ